ncbi:MAG: SAM-dependent methyltransferase [Devosiaceae bacterium]|nr:SAM-dependent methyltransferase [Devosiaceae bacterium MH13]
MAEPNPLAALIKAEIEATGPITVSHYMHLCLNHPTHGYYAAGAPIGAAGDFTTAPEVSQLFGELIGAWLIAAWEQLGRPAPFALTELGPGRGTLMKDVLRVARSVPAFFEAAQVIMVETSAPLREQQCATLSASGKPVTHAASLDAVPPLPSLIVANEFLDALPADQWVRTDKGWHKRKIGLDADGALTFGLDPTPHPQPPKALNAPAPPGSVVEHSPAQDAVLTSLCDHLNSQGGAALMIDYGALEPGTGDTLQAVRKHEKTGPLTAPGSTDLTTHVDFHYLGQLASKAGLQTVQTATQGGFLVKLGLLERAGQLGAHASEAERDAISIAVERLASDAAMGQLFKVMAISPAPLAFAGFESEL